MKYFKMMFFFLDFNIGILLVYLPVLLRNTRSLTEAQVGTLFMIAGVVAIFGGILSGLIAQKTNDIRKVLRFGTILMTFGIIMLLYVDTYYAIMFSFLFIFFARSTLYFLSDELTINYINSGHPYDFGKVRSFGAAGWATNFFINGLIITYAPQFFIPIWMVAITMLIYTTFRLPKPEKIEQKELKFSDIKRIFKIRDVVLFMIVSGLVWGTITNVQTYAQYFVQDLGGSLTIYAMINGIVGILDFIFMQNSSKIRNKVGERLYILGLLTLILIKYVIIAFALDPIYLYMQVFIDPVFFGLFIPFSSVFIKRHIDQSMSAIALTLITSINLALASILSLVFGYMYEFVSPRSVFLIMAFVVFLAILFASRIKFMKKM
jgi:PPP family 3-phenylpropionic acid transporter